MKRSRLFVSLAISGLLLVLSFGNANAFNQNDLNQFLRTFRCYGCDLSGADLSNKNLPFTTLSLSNLKGTKFNNTNLTGSTIIGSDLTGAQLIGATVDMVNFSQSDLTGANVTNWQVTRFTIFYNAKWTDGTGCGMLVGACAKSGSQSPVHLKKPDIR